MVEDEETIPMENGLLGVDGHGIPGRLLSQPNEGLPVAPVPVNPVTAEDELGPDVERILRSPLAGTIVPEHPQVEAFMGGGPQAVELQTCRVPVVRHDDGLGVGPVDQVPAFGSSDYPHPQSAAFVLAVLHVHGVDPTDRIPTNGGRRSPQIALVPPPPGPGFAFGIDLGRSRGTNHGVARMGHPVEGVGGVVEVPDPGPLDLRLSGDGPFGCYLGQRLVAA